MNIGEKLRQLRKQIHKYTLSEVSDLTGLSVSFLSDIERGRTNPSLETLEKLANCYGIAIGEILQKTREDNIKTKQLPEGFKEAIEKLDISPEMQEVMLLVEHRSNKSQKKTDVEDWIRLYYSLKTIME